MVFSVAILRSTAAYVNKFSVLSQEKNLLHQHFVVSVRLGIRLTTEIALSHSSFGLEFGRITWSFFAVVKKSPTPRLHLKSQLGVNQ